MLTEEQQRRCVHHSTQVLEQAIRDSIDTLKADPRAFQGTKSADDILATIKRFCLRTLDTAQRQQQLVKTSETGCLVRQDIFNRSDSSICQCANSGVLHRNDPTANETRNNRRFAEPSKLSELFDAVLQDSYSV